LAVYTAYQVTKTPEDKAVKVAKTVLPPNAKKVLKLTKEDILRPFFAPF
jgi:hypothetical protein